MQIYLRNSVFFSNFAPNYCVYMMRLSFIVPFYNVEKYIEECIRSLYNQDIPKEEYEVICVDDCSPDGSRAIVARLQKEYPTLRLLVHKENKRQGGARNTGLKEAKGQYVWFVDSDDFVYPNVLKTLLEKAEANKLDVLQFDHSRGKWRYQIQENPSDIQEGELYLFEDQRPDWFYKVVAPWRQLIRRKFLLEAQLLFVEHAMYEDSDYMLRVMMAAKRVQYIPLLAYCYRVNDESISEYKSSPIKVAWRINQIVRCRRSIDDARTQSARDFIGRMVYQSLTRIRPEVKEFSFKQRCEYVRYLLPDMKKCRRYVNWRTWLAIRYGITMFI